MIVVDCAAIVDVLTGAPDSDILRHMLTAHELHAPTLIDAEVVSAVRGLVRGKYLSVARAKDALADFDALPLRRWLLNAPLRLRMFSLRDNLSAYDAAYVALAEALSVELFTRDARLVRSSGHAVTVRVL